MTSSRECDDVHDCQDDGKTWYYHEGFSKEGPAWVCLGAEIGLS